MTMRMRTSIVALAALAAAAASPGLASGVEVEVEDHAFSFEGPFGLYKADQLQRGLQIFNEVCSSCHGMKYVSFRTLGDEQGPALPEEQVKAFAAQFEYPKEDDPEEFRAGVASDYFITPEYFGDGHPPDLSLMAKARAGFHGPIGLGINQMMRGTGGPEYIYSLLTGYRDTPECALDNEPNGYYNVAFAAGAFPADCIDEHGHHMVPGSWIAMPPQLYDGAVEYMDGTDPSEHQLAEDISAFLMWTAEPKMMDRKEAGLRNFLWLGVLAVLMYFVNKKVWAPVKGDRH